MKIIKAIKEVIQENRILFGYSLIYIIDKILKFDIELFIVIVLVYLVIMMNSEIRRIDKQIKAMK